MEHPAFEDALAAHRDRGLTGWSRSLAFGALPSHRCTVLELVVLHDPLISNEHLLIKTVLRDRLDGSVVSSRTDVCHALPLDAAWDEEGHSGGALACELYVREMCQMIAPVVRAHRLKMRSITRVIEVMNASWDLLGVFQEVENLDAVFRARQRLLQDLEKNDGAMNLPPDSPVPDPSPRCADSPSPCPEGSST
jgi:hypothetical protein